MARSTEIKFNVSLDDKNLPESINWTAEDGNQLSTRPCKSMMVSVWDPEQKNTMRIDLWTKDMSIDEMHTHFLQTMMTMSESYQRATGNPFILESMEAFCKDTAEKIKSFENKRRSL